MDKRRKPSDTRQKPISKERLSRLASFPELSPDPVMELDLSGNIQYLNPTAKRLFPELPEKGIKHPYLAGWETLSAFLRDKEGIGFRREIKVNGSWYVQSVEYAPASRTIRIYGSDTTERKQAEEALRASEEKFRNLVENAPVGISITTMDGRRILRNKAQVRMLGYGSVDEQFLDPVAAGYYNPEDRKRFVKLASEGIVKDFEVLMKRKDGTPVWVSFTAIPQTTEAGEKQFITIIQDISERKKAEEALRTSEQLYRSLFENMLNGFAYCKMLFENNKPQDFIYLGVNSAFETQTGLKNVVGKKVSEVIPGIRESDPQLFEIYGRVALTGVPERFETFVDALKMWFSISVYSPQKEYFVAVFDVVTERKKAEEALKSSEEKYRTLLESLPVGVALVTYDGHSLERNKATMNMHGYDSREEFMKVSTDDLYYDVEDRKRFLELATRGPVMDFEVRHKRKDGSPFWVLQSTIPFVTESGETQLIAVSQDITERKRAEEALRESEAKYSTLVEKGNDGIVIIGDGLIEFASSRLLKMTGFSLEETLGKPFIDFVAPADRNMVIDRYQRRIRGEDVPNNYEISVITKNGKTVPIEISASRIDYKGKAADMAIIRDITERKKAEEELRESEEFGSSLLNNSPNPIIVINPDSSIRYVNPALEKLTGFSSGEVIGKKPPYPWWKRQKVTQEGIAILLGEIRGEGKSHEALNVKKNGEEFWVEITAKPTAVSGKLNFLVANWVDITERKQAEEALRASEAKFRNLVENAPVGIVVNTVGGRPIERNKATMEMHGYASKEELNRVPIPDLYFDPEDRNRFLESLAKGTVRNFETRHKRKDGSVFWISLTAIPQVGERGEKQMLVISQDIDERKRAEEALKASEAKFRNLVENAPVGIALSTTDGRFERNKAFQEMHGYDSRKEFMKVSTDDLYYDAADRKRFIELATRGPVRGFEVRHKRKDGSCFWVSQSTIPFATESGETQLIAVVQDIDEKKKAEEALKVSEERFRSLLENAPVGITVSTTNGQRLEANKALIQMQGFGSREELLAAPVADTYYDPEERKHFMSRLGKGPVQNYEVRRKRKDGSVFWASLNSITYIDSSGEKLLINVIADISERKQAEEALKASEERYRSLVEELPIGIGVSTLEGRSIQRNKALMEMYGYKTKEELSLVDTPTLYYDPTDRQRFLELSAKGPVRNFETRFKRQDGTVFWVSINSIMQTALSGETVRLTVIQDIDTEKKAEAENQLKATLLDAAGDMIYLHDLPGKIIYINDAGCRAHGYTRDEVMKTNIRDLLTPEKAEMISHWNEELLKKGEIKFETQHIRKDGSILPMEVDNRLVKLDDEYAVICVGRDITERKKAEEQMIVTSRLASIGELASGVAHEINNPLTSVIGFSELLLERPLPVDIKEDLTTIRDEAQRASRVVKNLLTFARTHPVSKEPVDVNNIIEKVLELRVYEQTANNIRVVLRLAPDLPKINADSYQLQQVFFNLIVNAEYFMIEAHNKGTLTITTEDVDDAVRISFADDGPGISAESLQHLFNPFFTTKPVGKGTGLGLSICHGIITAHGGRIYAESTYGKGATFIVEIPFTR